MGDIELLPCPFCAKSVEAVEVPTATSPIMHHPVYDGYCAVAGRFFPVSAWNTRAATARELALVEALTALFGAAPDFALVVPDAADLLEQYAEYIRTVHSSELERHPYLPEVECVIADLRAALAKARAS